MGVALIYAGRRTFMTKVTGVLQDYAKALEKWAHFHYKSHMIPLNAKRNENTRDKRKLSVIDSSFTRLTSHRIANLPFSISEV